MTFASALRRFRILPAATYKVNIRMYASREVHVSAHATYLAAAYD